MKSVWELRIRIWVTQKDRIRLTPLMTMTGATNQLSEAGTWADEFVATAHEEISRNVMPINETYKQVSSPRFHVKCLLQD